MGSQHQHPGVDVTKVHCAGVAMFLLLASVRGCVAWAGGGKGGNPGPATDTQGMHWINESETTSWTVRITQEPDDGQQHAFKQIEPLDPKKYPISLVLPTLGKTLGLGGQPEVQEATLKPGVDAVLTVKNNATSGIKKLQLTFYSKKYGSARFCFLAMGNGKAKLLLEKSNFVDAADVYDFITNNSPGKGSITFKDPPE